MTASISARNRSRRVTFPFWLHAIPANVRCSPIPNLPPSSLDALLFYHGERLTQSFPRPASAFAARLAGECMAASPDSDPRRRSGKGVELGVRDISKLPLALPVTPQLQTTDTCWEATNTAAQT